MEKARGTADMQAELAAAQVSIEINGNRAQAREAEAGGEPHTRGSLARPRRIGSRRSAGRGEGDRGARRGPGRGLRGAARRSARCRPHSSRWRTRSRRATSPSCPRFSSPAAALVWTVWRRSSCVPLAPPLPDPSRRSDQPWLTLPQTSPLLRKCRPVSAVAVSCSKIAASGQKASPHSTFCPEAAIIHKGLLVTDR